MNLRTAKLEESKGRVGSLWGISEAGDTEAVTTTEKVTLEAINEQSSRYLFLVLTPQASLPHPSACLVPEVKKTGSWSQRWVWSRAATLSGAAGTEMKGHEED